MQQARLDDDLLARIEAAAFTADPAGVISRWNPAAERLFGVSGEAAVGRDSGEVLGPLLHGEEAAGVLAAIRHPADREAEVEVRTARGPLTCSLRVSPAGHDGADLGTVVIAVDLTERVRAERRLAAQYAAVGVLASAERFSEAGPPLLARVAESIGWHLGALWILDEGSGLLRFVDLWHAPDLDASELRSLSRGLAFARGEGFPGRVWDAGGPLWVEHVPSDPGLPRAGAMERAGLRAAMGFPVRLGERVYAVLEFFTREPVARDERLLEAMDAVGSQVGQFIERARVQEDVRDREARRSAIFEAALDAIVAMDHRGRITEFNPAAERMFGYGREEAIGRDLAELLIPPSLRERHRRGLGRYLRTGESGLLGRRVELSALRKDGSEFPIELAVTRVALHGSPTFKGFIRDLTERQEAGRALEESQERLRQALAAGSMGVWEWDLSTDAVRWSASLEEIHGLAPGAFPGTFEAFAKSIHADDREHVMTELARAVREGDAYRAQYRLAGGEGAARWMETHGRVERDETGAAVRVTGLTTDITERRHAEELRLALLERERAAREQAEAARERLAFLAEASAILSASLNQDRTLEKIANLAVPRLSDWCVVYLRTEEGAIERVAMAHVDPARAALADEIRGFHIDPDAAGGVPLVLRTGEPSLIPVATARDLASDVDDPERLARLLEMLGIGSWMCVPLQARGRILGAISFISAESGRRYGADDLALADELCGHAALAVDNARLYEERSHVARTLQRSLLPASLPEMPGVEVAARYEAAGEVMRVGGDFYDLFEGDPGAWYVVVGDVQGKGPEAASLTGLARHTVRAAAADGRPPAAVLSALNDAVGAEGTERFCTVACARVTAADGGLQAVVSCGGHPLPRAIRADGAVEPIGRHGTLLGLFDDPELHDREAVLGPGDALVLFTDGVIEGRPDGDGSLDDFLGSLAGRDAAGIAAGLEAWARDVSGESLRDDVAILVLRVSEEWGAGGAR